MKGIIQDLMEAAAELLDEPLRSGVRVLASFVSRLDLPEGDDRWRKVTKMLVGALDEMRELRHLDERAQMRARLILENRMHHQLREFGLIEVDQ